MHHSVLATLARCELAGKSPVRAYLRFSRRVWRRLPPVLLATRPVRSYGVWLNSLVQLGAVRRFNFGTLFFRNRPQLELMRRLAREKSPGSVLTVAVLACSKGTEVYSILWSLRTARPDLHVRLHALDVSHEVLDFARAGTYSLTTDEFANVPVFGQILDTEMREMFDRDGDRARVKDWLREGVSWHLGDARARDLADSLGRHDMVVGNNFLCHMSRSEAESCLANLARLVRPGGYLFVSGVDLDIRTRVARDQGWEPVLDLLDDIHEGDRYLRVDWPWEYWGLEPLNKRRRDWKLRYASAFRIGEAGSAADFMSPASGRDHRGAADCPSPPGREPMSSSTGASPLGLKAQR